MGVAYCATHLALEGRAALKLLAPTGLRRRLRARFQQESRLAARIHHPNLVDSHRGYQAGFLGQNGAASPPVLGPRNWPPEAGKEVATGRAPSRAPTTPMRASRCRRISTRAGRRRSSARPWP
jgi:hypothetical protein